MRLSPTITLLIRLAALVLASILGIGAGWLAGGALAPAIARFVGFPNHPERPGPQTSSRPAANEEARQDSTPESREKPDPEPDRSAGGVGGGKKEELPLEERLKREALNEMNKRIEQARREIEKRIGLDEKVKSKGEREKNGRARGKN